MTSDILHLYGKAIGGLSAAVLSWLGNSIAQVIAPDQSWTVWLDRYGLPLVMLVIALYVIRALYFALQKEQENRLADKEASLQQWRSDFIAAQEQREKIADKLDEQTAELKALKEKFQGCSLQNRNRS
jgi:hypothetical protein